MSLFGKKEKDEIARLKAQMTPRSTFIFRLI